MIVDARPAAAFAAGHVPGTLSIPLDGAFTTWAGWLLPYDREVYLLVNGGDDVAEAARDLAMIGLDRVGGWIGTDAFAEWSARGTDRSRSSNRQRQPRWRRCSSATRRR